MSKEAFLGILTLDMLKESYEQMIDKRNESEYAVKSLDDKKVWYSPSSAGSCIKQHLFKELKTERDPLDQSSKFAMRYGNIIHDELQSSLKNYLKVPENSILMIEKFLSNEELNLRGFVDILIWNPIENTGEIIDIKTIKAYKWQRMFGQKKNRDPNPSRKYELQLGSYGIMFESELKSKVKELSLIYYRKDDGMMKKIIVPIRYLDLATEYWEEVKYVLRDTDGNPENLIPGESINVPVETWECNWCSYASKCNSPFRKK